MVKNTTVMSANCIVYYVRTELSRYVVKLKTNLYSAINRKIQRRLRTLCFKSKTGPLKLFIITSQKLL